MSTNIAVAGGTGLVGAMVVEEVRRAGATPVVIARSRGIDLTTGAGLAEALDGVDAVIDASNVDTLRAKRSVAFFEAATGRLLRWLNAGAFTLESVDRETDRYDRKLRIVTRGGDSVGDMLVDEGLARRWEGRRRPWC